MQPVEWISQGVTAVLSTDEIQEDCRELLHAYSPVHGTQPTPQPQRAAGIKDVLRQRWEYMTLDLAKPRKGLEGLNRAAADG